MARGKRINLGELDLRLINLDIDEGIRIEPTNWLGKASDRHIAVRTMNGNLYVNRRASGTFVLQHNDKFYYLESPSEVRTFIDQAFPSRASIWAY